MGSGSLRGRALALAVRDALPGEMETETEHRLQLDLGLDLHPQAARQLEVQADAEAQRLILHLLALRRPWRELA